MPKPQPGAPPGLGKPAPAEKDLKVGPPRVAPAAPRPFDIKSRTIQARIIRGAGKSTVDELFCEGAVHVVQAPAKEGERKTEVKGHTLKMSAALDNCHVLEVTGGSDPKLLENDTAELHTDKMQIIGPQIIINQYQNRAWVVGDGAMTMESNTNFQGDALKTPKPLHVQWKDGMNFDGSGAEFNGEVHATQDNAKLTCQTMNVVFDRVVSLKHSNIRDPARVRYISCTKDVKVEETVVQDKQFMKYQLLESVSMTMEAVEPTVRIPAAGSAGAAKGAAKEANRNPASANKVVAQGPGLLRVIEQGGNSAVLPGAGLAPPGRPGESARRDAERDPKSDTGRLKLTHVTYEQRMDASSDTGMVSFWGRVQVVHIPLATPDTKVSVDRILAVPLPEGGLYLRCNRLKVMDRTSDGKPNKRMEAIGGVRVSGRDFEAFAESVTFDESKDLIIFDSPGGLSKLTKTDVPGGKPQVVSGKTILFNRKTKDTKIEGTSTIHGSTGP
jgi:hypothetical protein